MMRAEMRAYLQRRLAEMMEYLQMMLAYIYEGVLTEDADDSLLLVRLAD
jgi:hypothetical protein